MNSPEPDRDEGRLGRRRQTYLEESLEHLSDDKIKVVAFHHHLVPVPYSGRETNVLEDAGDILDTVLKHDVNLVLMGHRHVRRVLRINNTTLVNAGTVSSVRTRGRFGYSFNIIDIHHDGTVQVTEQSLTEKRTIPLK
jgi:3',5'-cyclic AMP phosphodiesterase CpdA